MKSPFRIPISNDLFIESTKAYGFTISWDNADGSSGMNTIGREMSYQARNKDEADDRNSNEEKN
jgi:hypothetical protein